jgi:hypothetical protein
MRYLRQSLPGYPESQHRAGVAMARGLGVARGHLFAWPCRSVPRIQAALRARTGWACRPLFGAKSRTGSPFLRSAAPSNKCTYERRRNGRISGRKVDVRQQEGRQTAHACVPPPPTRPPPPPPPPSALLAPRPAVRAASTSLSTSRLPALIILILWKETRQCQGSAGHELAGMAAG